jgi:hypothetical protein
MQRQSGVDNSHSPVTFAQWAKAANDLVQEPGMYLRTYAAVQPQTWIRPAAALHWTQDARLTPCHISLRYLPNNAHELWQTVRMMLAGSP